MDSKLEQAIDDIFAFVESCKMQSFSSTKAIVPKNDLYDLLEDLRRALPNEIKRYQKILNQRESILDDARKKADSIKADARAQYGAMVEEHEIAREATRQAEFIIQQANANAEQIIAEARQTADEIATGAIYYTADLLNAAEKSLSQAYQSTVNNSKALEVALRGHLEEIAKNKAELGPVASQRAAVQKAPVRQAEAPAGQGAEEQGKRTVEPKGQRKK